MEKAANKSIVYLIPSLLHEAAGNTIPFSILEAVQQCEIFFVENERSARRYLKQLWKDMVIDDYTWVTMHKVEKQVKQQFKHAVEKGKIIGIISEAGCPGVADPGQILIETAHQLGALVKPLVGPNAILLALMASGLNGQQFQFTGYLPIDIPQRMKRIKALEEESARKNCTQLFIETPYRNNRLLETILKTCQPDTLLSIACSLTGPDEFIATRPIKNWKRDVPDLHKKPAIFSLLAVPAASGARGSR